MGVRPDTVAARPGFLADGGRFLGAGVVNTLLTLAIYQILLFAMPATLAYAVTWLVGIAFVAIVYPSHVFKGSQLRRGTRLRVIGVYIVGFGLGTGVVAAFDAAFGLERIAIFVALFFTTAFNFLAMRAVTRGRAF